MARSQTVLAVTQETRQFQPGHESPGRRSCDFRHDFSGELSWRTLAATSALRKDSGVVLGSWQAS